MDESARYNVVIAARFQKIFQGIPHKQTYREHIHTHTEREGGEREMRKDGKETRWEKKEKYQFQSTFSSLSISKEGGKKRYEYETSIMRENKPLFNNRCKNHYYAHREKTTRKEYDLDRVKSSGLDNPGGEQQQHRKIRHHNHHIVDPVDLAVMNTDDDRIPALDRIR